MRNFFLFFVAVLIGLSNPSEAVSGTVIIKPPSDEPGPWEGPQPTLLTVSPYRGLADSPFQPVYFEDFEDGEFDSTGLKFGRGLNLLYPPGVRSHSVREREPLNQTAIHLVLFLK